MPLAGRLTDRYGPSPFPAMGLPLIALGLVPFAFITATSSYVLLSAGLFVSGLGMGFAMMPTMTAAMQAVPAAAIARTSTAMNIIRQSGASIGTAVLTVILASTITANLAGLGGGAPSGESGLSSLHNLSPAAQAKISEPVAEAFSQTFVWALVLMAVAFIPALAMALKSRGEKRPAAGSAPAVVLE
jgi:MFS family permease